jgi:hypothetical protein
VTDLDKTGCTGLYEITVADAVTTFTGLTLSSDTLTPGKLTYEVTTSPVETFTFDVTVTATSVGEVPVVDKLTGISITVQKTCSSTGT